MLLLLGDQLIRDAGLAVFELVKNAYDADATKCTITLNDVDDSDTATVTIEDNGCGMTYDTVMHVWLEPGTDYRAKARAGNIRSPKFERLPLGEKGVGRFAVHKLGREIELITRSKLKDEVVVRIDWLEFASAKYLADVPVEVIKRKPLHFKGNRHGTRIVVKKLWSPWTRRRVRELHRAITSISSPFEAPDQFTAKMGMAPDLGWLSGLLNAETVLSQALYQASGRIGRGTVRFDYHFTPLPRMRSSIAGRERSGFNARLMEPGTRRARTMDLKGLKIGPIKFDFSIFDLEPAVLALGAVDKKGLKEYLNANGGVRVYRDGIRIFDLGEPGNDWLDLEGRRVNRPTVKIGNNQIIGAVHLNAAKSQGLIEKTNREGFIENEAYRRFHEAVIFALKQVEVEREKDKRRLRQLYSRKALKEPVVEELGKLREQIESHGLTEELGGYIDRVEKQFLDVRERLLTAAGPGLTLTVVIHEVEKIIAELSRALKANAPRQKVVALAKHLSEIVDGLSFLVRKSGNSREKAGAMIAQALFNTEYRLRAHRIKVVNGLEDGNRDFAVKCMRRLVISTLMNLIDNSIYWLENRGAANKQLYVGTSFEVDDLPSIVVADNGSGFKDPPEYLKEPFFTRKPDGMGLGLHIADEIARLHEGKLVFPEPGELDLPSQFTGAIIAFQFPKAV
jgi:signal transduction histidine kinase